MSPGLYTAIFVVFQSLMMRKAIAILAITLVPTLYSSANNHAFDCSDPTNMDWPHSGAHTLDILEKFHTRKAQSSPNFADFHNLQAEICRDVVQLHSLLEEADKSRKQAAEWVKVAKSRLSPGTVVAFKDMKGPEMDKAKRLLVHAKNLDQRAGMQKNTILIKRARYDPKTAAVVLPEMAMRLKAVKAILESQ